MKTCALVLAALVSLSASEEVFPDDGLSLLQLRATTHGTGRSTGVLCSVIVDTSDQPNAETGGGGYGQFLVDDNLTDKRWFQKPIAKDQVVNTEPEELACAPASVRITAGTTDGWGYHKVSINCGGVVQVLFDHPLGGHAYSSQEASQDNWVDQPPSAVSAHNDYPITQAIAGLGVCGAPPTTPPPTPAPPPPAPTISPPYSPTDSASAVGDPHLTTNSGHKSDMCCTDGVCTPC